jgi:hypothetical protein
MYPEFVPQKTPTEVAVNKKCCVCRQRNSEYVCQFLQTAGLTAYSVQMACSRRYNDPGGGVSFTHRALRHLNI